MYTCSFVLYMVVNDKIIHFSYMYHRSHLHCQHHHHHTGEKLALSVSGVQFLYQWVKYSILLTLLWGQGLIQDCCVCMEGGCGGCGGWGGNVSKDSVFGQGLHVAVQSNLPGPAPGGTFLYLFLCFWLNFPWCYGYFESVKTLHHFKYTSAMNADSHDTDSCCKRELYIMCRHI